MANKNLRVVSFLSKDTTLFRGKSARMSICLIDSKFLFRGCYGECGGFDTFGGGFEGHCAGSGRCAENCGGSP